MDTAQWPQVFREVKTMEGSRSMTGKKPRPQKEQALNCPRCNSTNTKFCYYNNYSLTQPRYFCKTCRRYWTEGGSLRNVPVGGGSRKNKRSTSSSVPASSKRLPDLIPPSFSMQSASQNPKINNEGQDLNLAYPPTSLYSTMSEFVGLPTYTDNTTDHHQNPNFPCASTQISAMEVLKTGIASQEGLTSFISLPHTDSSIYSSDLPLQELKPSLDFSMNGNGHSGYGNLQGTSEIGARLFFPYEDLKSVSNAAEFEQNRVQEDSSVYWNGVVGGGSW